MFHIHPIPENKVNKQIKEVYTNIKDTFELDTVPVMFQYLANYEVYLLYIWERMKANMDSNSFTASYKDIMQFADTAIESIYSPSSAIATFIKTVPAQEKEQINQTIQTLEKVNAKLMLLTIGVRESVKGVLIGTERLTPYSRTEHMPFEDFIKSNFSRNETAISSSSHILAPLFGSHAIVVSHYPQFFQHIAIDMEKLLQSEGYLTKRVNLEQKGLLAVTQFTHPLGCSYKELVIMAGGKPYFDELLYMLSETFPSQFPRLVLTSA